MRALLLMALAGVPGLSSAQTPCEVPDDGSGTVQLPPQGCGYVSPNDLHMIINGLPPGTTIEIGVEHADFFNISSFPGGSLGGEVEQFQSILIMQMNGTGSLSGFNRVLTMQAQCEVHTGPRSPGNPVQQFPTEMMHIQGQITGDPDFDLLRVTAGTAFGMPSPGHTTLTQLPSSNWNVDSFFDIEYRIDFIGAPGGPLAGQSGSTTDNVIMQGGVFVNPPAVCQVADNGTGTVSLPPPGCGYVSPQDLHMMIDGLPPGTTIEVAAEHAQFFNVTTFPDPVGGEIEQFQSFLQLDMNGTGNLAGFHRNISLQIQCQTHTDPRTPGMMVQSFDTEMMGAQGQIGGGDPDFDLLRITAGSSFGLPSPGHTTLTRLPGPGGMYNVDSFFDITYRIDFVGRPGSVLGGMSGSTTGTIRMQAGVPVQPVPDCVVQDNGTGTIDLPPQGCGYVSPEDLHMMINGLPPGTTINVSPEHSRFFNVQATPGGDLGGEVEHFSSSLLMTINGTGELEGYQRTIEMMPVQCEVHTAPRHPGDPLQSFPAKMEMLQGQLPPGDPDFDLLRITAGNGFGMPSPGHTTLRQIPGTTQWAVDSFFDIFYEIEFTGAPGGPLGGMSGSTTGTIRMSTGNPDPTVSVEPTVVPGRPTYLLASRPNPLNPSTTIPFVLADGGKVDIRVYDAQGRRVRTLASGSFAAGRFEVEWDGKDNAGTALGAGTYFFELRVNDKVVDAKKAVIVR